MKFIKKFENFGGQDLGPRFSREEEEIMPINPNTSHEYEEDDDCKPCDTYDSEDDDDPISSEEDDSEKERRTWGDEIVESLARFNDFISEKKKQKEVSYEESGLKNPDKADLDKNKKISPYEKARGKAVQDAIEDKKEEKGGKGLTAAQKKLPEGLRKAIEAKNKKKK
jgi:hypothetical protein